MTDRHPDLVLCARYSDAPTASIAIGALFAHDIPAISDNEIMNSILPPAVSIRFMACPHDPEQAQAILADAGRLVE